MRESEPGRQSASPDEMFVLTEYYIYAGYARGDGDMLAKLADTHDRVVDRGHTRIGRKDQEVQFRRQLPSHHSSMFSLSTFISTTRKD